MKTKVTRKGKTAVLYSPGFGAGWSTWNTELGSALVFCPALVKEVLGGTHVGLTDEQVLEMLGLPADTYIYTGGLSQLKVEWLPVGTQFEISEYDGSESVRIHAANEWLTA